MKRGEIFAGSTLQAAMTPPSSSSFSSRRKRLVVPLIQCPSCNDQTIMKRTAMTDANQGNIF
uniref:Uncharacterized protein n=1 Tax=Oryza glumipatula TaxID=40148 RepID=A0A0E0BTJ4_9ORYZ